jgi:hypothetical protein
LNIWNVYSVGRMVKPLISPSPVLRCEMTHWLTIHTSSVISRPSTSAYQMALKCESGLAGWPMTMVGDELSSVMAMGRSRPVCSRISSRR